MNFNVEQRTILLVRHGSHAYGTSVPTSDLDVKGICIEPLEYHLGFLHKFEQHESMGSKHDDIDKVIYSLKKFANLAADCNPNIVEVLHVSDSDVLALDEFGEELRANRNAFISKKAKHTFSGYAHAQLKRIKTHRSWILNPPSSPPTRKAFGLSEERNISQSELGAFDASIEKGHQVTLPKEMLTVYTREKAFQAAKLQYDQYVNWVKSRNPARAELEARYHYDTKHGMHLLRLMRMCKEILATGQVIVKRPDAEELLRVRNGFLSYEELVEQAETLEKECDVLYQTSTLPHQPDRNKLDQLIVSMTQRYLTKHG